MKKFLVWCMVVALAVTMSFSAFAAPGKFVQSPSNNPCPDLIEGSNSDPDCTAELVITAYIDRNTLPPATLAMIEYAYNVIKNCSDLTTLSSAFASYVGGLGIPGTRLKVSDLFDVSYYNCDTHDHHGSFSIKLSADTLKNFVGLLHYTGNGWEFVTDAKVAADGVTLTFSVDSLSPFAIVVDTGAASDVSPDTGYNDFAVCTAMFASAAAMVVLFASRKRNKA